MLLYYTFDIYTNFTLWVGLHLTLIGVQFVALLLLKCGCVHEYLKELLPFYGACRSYQPYRPTPGCPATVG